MKTFIAKFIDAINAKKKDSPNGTLSISWKAVYWIVGIILLGVGLYMYSRRGRLLAKLQHEANVAEEKKLELEAAKKIAAKQEEVDALQVEISKLDTEAAVLKKNIHNLRVESTQFHENLNQIGSWDALNKAFEK